MKISSLSVGKTIHQPSFGNLGLQQPNNVVSFRGQEVDKTTLDSNAMLAILALGGINGANMDAEKMNEAFKTIIDGQAPIKKDVDDIKRFQSNITVNKHSQVWNDLLLLTQNNVLNRNSGKYARALSHIETIGQEKLTSSAGLPIIDKENPVVWSVTSEFAPVKEGGLGSVPPEIRNNCANLGISMPTFIPMYLNQGLTSLVKNEETNRYTYTHKGNVIPLEKIATTKIDVYKNGIPKSIPVSYYLNTDKDPSTGAQRQLIFVQADDYFDGTIYEANSKTEEPEKFALFSKSVYEFAKMKIDGLTSAKDLVIHNQKAFSDIKEPDAMILNDWQASPTAALLRYKAVMENAHGQLSDSATQKLKNMALVTIGHNVTYQGATYDNNDYFQRKEATSNILNTLFDRYAYDIVAHAKSGASEIDPNNPEAKVMDNVLVLRSDEKEHNFTNFLNMGIVLSDYFAPVSQNYANELVDPQRKDLSWILQWSLTQKSKAGKLVGVINGNDFKNLSIEAKKAQTKKLTGVELETYKKDAPLNEILKKRFKNKVKLYNDFVLPFTKSMASSLDDIEKVESLTGRLEFAKCNSTTMPILSNEELAKTPILMSGGRLVSQKGMDVLCDAMKMLYDNWEKDFPNQNKPILYLAGADGENGRQRAIIEDFKNNQLSVEDSNRVLFAHGFAPMAGMMAASDFFLMPSIFEPCGLTQGESLALATPVIASAVGGIVDTINRNGKFNGVLTDKTQQLTAQGYYEALKEGLEIFFNDKEKYNQMVQDSIDEDFSWSINNKGPVHDYLHLLGIKK